MLHCLQCWGLGWVWRAGRHICRTGCWSLLARVSSSHSEQVDRDGFRSRHPEHVQQHGDQGRPSLFWFMFDHWASILFFRFYIVFFYFQNCDSPCELEVGEVGEEMSLWTGGRVKAQETLGGRFRSLHLSQLLSLKNLKDLVWRPARFFSRHAGVSLGEVSSKLSWRRSWPGGDGTGILLEGSGPSLMPGVKRVWEEKAGRDNVPLSQLLPTASVFRKLSQVGLDCLAAASSIDLVNFDF